MLIKNISPTTLITSGVGVAVSWVIGLMTVSVLFVVFSYLNDARNNYNAVKQLDIVSVGRIHTFSGITSKNGSNIVHHDCVAVEVNNDVMMRDKSAPSGSSAYCNNLFIEYLPNWKLLASPDSMKIIERSFWSVAICVVVIAGFYLALRIPAILICCVVKPLMPYYNLVTFVFLLPVFYVLALFLSSAWEYHPKLWVTPDGRGVSTEAIYVTKDGSLYNRPESSFEWTQAKAGKPIR
ncbi:hypothetical protein Xoosp13_92 [Xanthomonas phage Xoo-sp13]|nr:hypothetical protein Xoosp13_92 [Xanthomonas phage Xoo-sp13]